MVSNFPALFRRQSKNQAKDVGTPDVAWLLTHRKHRWGKKLLTKGDTPTASLYRMYECLVIGYIEGLRSEVEHFFNNPLWTVSDIPDPKDFDTARYAIVAVLSRYLALVINDLLTEGLPRGTRSIIASEEVEKPWKGQNRVMEEVPSWVDNVSKLDITLVIPDKYGNEPEEEARSAEFLSMNIVVQEPNLVFL